MSKPVFERHRNRIVLSQFDLHCWYAYFEVLSYYATVIHQTGAQTIQLLFNHIAVARKVFVHAYN